MERNKERNKEREVARGTGSRLGAICLRITYATSPFCWDEHRFMPSTPFVCLTYGSVHAWRDRQGACIRPSTNITASFQDNNFTVRNLHLKESQISS
jgi:hypothetical protein